MNKQMPDGLAELGPSTSDAGRLGILLIVISYPGEPDQSGQIGSQWAHPDHCWDDEDRVVVSISLIEKGLEEKVTGRSG